MPRKQEISEYLRLRIVELHKDGMGYKIISKTIGIHQSTVRNIIRKWRLFNTVATLPRSGRPSKLTPRAQRKMLKEKKKNPRVTAKGLKKTLEQVNVSVHESTIRRRLNSLCRRTRRRKSQLSTKITTVRPKEESDNSEKAVWTEETKDE